MKRKRPDSEEERLPDNLGDCQSTPARETKTPESLGASLDGQPITLPGFEQFITAVQMPDRLLYIRVPELLARQVRAAAALEGQKVSVWAAEVFARVLQK